MVKSRDPLGRDEESEEPPEPDSIDDLMSRVAEKRPVAKEDETCPF